MGVLTFQNATQQIEGDLFAAILLALQERQAVATLAALRAIPTAAASSGFMIPEYSLRYVTANAENYRWDPYSTAADDGESVIKPTDGGATGRWRNNGTAVSFRGVPLGKISTGYLRLVHVYAGDMSDDDLEALLYAQRPSVMVRFLGEDPTPASTIAGALYWNAMRFRITAVSENLRPGPVPSALVGPTLAAEAARDPGVHQIIGDLKELLAGSDLGQPGVGKVELGPTVVEWSMLGQRKQVHSLEVVVYCTLQAVDYDLVTINDFAIQYSIARLNQAAPPFDPLNYVESGYTVPLGAGFTFTPTAGVAYVNGTKIALTPGAHTAGPGLDIYRDIILSEGDFAYTSVRNGQEPPPVLPGALRVGVTITDANGVVADGYLAAWKYNFGDPDIVPGPFTE